MPWVDMADLMRAENVPLFSIETRSPIREFDMLGFTLQYEMSYTNILDMLDLAGIPLHSEDRTWDDPIVIAGGPCAYNPEPLADFFDLFVIYFTITRHDFPKFFKKSIDFLPDW